MTLEVACIASTRCSLGESPVWAPRAAALYWLDIGESSSLLRWDSRSGEVRRWSLPVLAGGLTLSASEQVIVLSQSGIGAFDVDTGTLTPLAPPPRPMGDVRFNDCGCDTAGRLWAGVMTNNFSSAPAVEGGLWRFDWRGGWQCMAMGFGCPNTFAWSPDATTFYAADSNRGRIYAHDFDGTGGRLANSRTLAGDPPGIPDGSAMDRDGCLWNARWGAGCVARLSPTGEVLELVSIPASLVTSCAFGGDEMNQLYITTAICDLSPDRLALEPLAGGLFRFQTHVPGHAPNRFAEQPRP